MNGRFGRTVGLVLLAAGATVAVLGCNSAKDDGANTAVQEALLTQDKHASRLADLEAKAQKADQQAAKIADQNTRLGEQNTRITEQGTRITELEKQVAALKAREPGLAAPARSPELEAILKEIAAELKSRPAAPRPDPEAALKYMRGVAEAFLTATLARNDQTMAATLTRSYK